MSQQGLGTEDTGAVRRSLDVKNGASETQRSKGGGTAPPDCAGRAEGVKGDIPTQERE